ncbi:MAG TPA: aminodeoxychorismate lyase, partial [Afipia sp.]|nr:aminodeoxychorismate lyase [Afipia sp.]
MSQRPPIAPRSPRAALEPEQVPQPPKHSQRARSTLVVVGNAIFTFLIIAMLIAGGVFFYGKKTIEAKGPLTEDKVVNIPPRAGMTDIGDILQRAGVITADRWTFIGSVLAMNARSGLKSGEYLFQKNASLRDVINTIVEGKVVQHAITIPEGLTSEQIVARLQDT